MCTTQYACTHARGAVFHVKDVIWVEAIFSDLRHTFIVPHILQKHIFCALAQTGRRTTRGGCCTLDTWHTPHVLMFRPKYSLTLSWYWETKLDSSCYQNSEYSRHICLPCKVRLPMRPPGYNCWVCFRAFFLCPLSCFKHSPGEKLLHCIYIHITHTLYSKWQTFCKDRPPGSGCTQNWPKTKHWRAAERLPAAS